MGWKGSYEFEDNNDWGGKAGLGLKKIMSGVERQVWIWRIMNGIERQVWIRRE
jgi:hypothetical protein